MNTVTAAASAPIAKLAWTGGSIICAMGCFAVMGAVLNHDNQSNQAIAVGLVGIVSGIFLLLVGSIVDRLSRIEGHLRAMTGTERIQGSPIDGFKSRVSASKTNLKYIFQSFVDVFTH